MNVCQTRFYTDCRVTERIRDSGPAYSHSIWLSIPEQQRSPPSQRLKLASPSSFLGAFKKYLCFGIKQENRDVPEFGVPNIEPVVNRMVHRNATTISVR